MYLSDALQVIEQNTERAYGGSHHARRYVELLDEIEHPRKVETADDIVARFNAIFANKNNDGEEVMDNGFV